VPELRLDHLIPQRRLDRRYVTELVRGLGASSLQADALVSDRTPARWVAGAALAGAPRLARTSAARWLGRFRPGSPVDRRLRHAFAAGWYLGLVDVVRRRRAGDLVGAALRDG
jgi:hypothetical protein